MFPGVNPQRALKVRRIISQQLGIDYDRIIRSNDLLKTCTAIKILERVIAFGFLNTPSTPAGLVTMPSFAQANLQAAIIIHGALIINGMLLHVAGIQNNRSG